MFGVEAAPAAAFFGLLFLTPESPRWLVAKGRVDEARGVLDVVGSDDRVEDIQRALADESSGRSESLFSKRYRRPVLMAVAMAAFNQLSGINAIIYYTPDIFRMAGFDRASALIQSVVIGGTNLALTMAGLSLIDRKLTGNAAEVIWLTALKLIANPILTFLLVTYVFVLDPLWAKAAWGRRLWRR